MLSFSEPVTEPRGDGPEGRLGPRDLRLVGVLGAMLGTGYLLLFLRSVFFESYETWIAYLMAPGLFLVAAPFLRRRLLTVEPDPWIRKVVVLGLAAKLLGAFARFYTNEFVLGRGDSVVYHSHGSALSGEFRSFIFTGPVVQDSLPDLSGTPFIRLLTGLLYTVTGPTRLGGFVAFSFLSFWGLYLFYRAHRIALPHALGRRYAVLLFFLPSMVFWPSSIGKEAWMTTMIGLGAYGAARIFTHERGGYLAAVMALAGMATVRPHVAAIFFVSLAAALTVRRSDSPTSQVKKVFGLLMLAALSVLLMRQLQSFFNLDSLDAQEVFERTTDRSAQGGSAFEASQPSSISGLPWAFVTVLFRPFMFEVGGATGMITAAEGSVLGVLFLWNLRSIGRAFRSLLKSPFITMVVVYSFLFVVAFSAVSNFGILARQRTQLYPLTLVLLTIPPAVATARDRKPLTWNGPTAPVQTVAPGLASALHHPSAPDRSALVSLDPSNPDLSMSPPRHAESNGYRTILALVSITTISALGLVAWATRPPSGEEAPAVTVERLIPTAVSSAERSTGPAVASTTEAPVISTTQPHSDGTTTTGEPATVATPAATVPPPVTASPTTRRPATSRPPVTTPSTTQAPTTTEAPTIPDVTFAPPTVLPSTTPPGSPASEPG